MPKTAPATPTPAAELPPVAQGGSYVIDPATGERTRLAFTAPGKQKPAPAPQDNAVITAPVAEE